LKSITDCGFKVIDGIDRSIID